MSIFKKPKAPAKTAEQKAGEIRTRSLLDKETEEEETRFKLLKSKRLGRVSLLAGGPRSITEAAGGARRGSVSGGGSLLARTAAATIGGGGTGSGGRPKGSRA